MSELLQRTQSWSLISFQKSHLAFSSIYSWFGFFLFVCFKQLVIYWLDSLDCENSCCKTWSHTVCNLNFCVVLQSLPLAENHIGFPISAAFWSLIAYKESNWIAALLLEFQECFILFEGLLSFSLNCAYWHLHLCCWSVISVTLLC